MAGSALANTSDNTFLDPFIEGTRMTKHNGNITCSMGRPVQDFSGYADGVVVGDHPLGPFTPQPDPFSYKPGGFCPRRRPWQHFPGPPQQLVAYFHRRHLSKEHTSSAGWACGPPALITKGVM